MCVNVISGCDLNKIAYLCKKESMIVYCEVCGKEHGQRPANIKRGWGKYCSRSCAMKAKMATLAPILAERAAKKHFQAAIKKFGDQVVFPSIPPKSINEKFNIYCETHGNVAVCLDNLKDNKFACPDCGTKKIVINEGKKKCSKCGEWKSLVEYGKDGTYSDGRVKLAAHCKSCQSERDKAKAGCEKRKQQVREAGERYKLNKGILPGKRFDYITICTCEQCKKMFVNKGKQIKRFCSKECGKEYRRINRIGKPLTITPKEYKCRSCKCTYIGKAPGRCEKCKKQAYRIAKKAQDKKRRVKQRTIAIHTVVDLKVFQRDKWKCKECGCRVQKKNIYADNAAEVDHIVPISLGGPHSYSNVQTLCRRCNQNKSNNYNGQLVLCL